MSKLPIAIPPLITQRLERIGRPLLRQRQDHRSGQHPQQGVTLRSLSGRRSQAAGRALRMALPSKARQLARSDESGGPPWIKTGSVDPSDYLLCVQLC